MGPLWISLPNSELNGAESGRHVNSIYSYTRQVLLFSWTVIFFPLHFLEELLESQMTICGLPWVMSHRVEFHLVDLKRVSVDL